MMSKPIDRLERNREHDAKRRKEQPWRAWYFTARWRANRIAQLRKQPLCERCFSNGEVKEATVAHHIQRHSGNPKLFWDPTNLASSCDDCHNVDEQRIERGGKARQRIGSDGWPIASGTD